MLKKLICKTKKKVESTQNQRKILENIVVESTFDKNEDFENLDIMIGLDDNTGSELDILGKMEKDSQDEKISQLEDDNKELIFQFDDDKNSRSSDEFDENISLEENTNTKWTEDLSSWSPNWLISFVSHCGPSSLEGKKLENPVDFFELFFDDNLINTMLEETWRYSQQFFEQNPEALSKNYYKAWNIEVLNPYSLKAFFAGLLYMGLVKLPTIRHHWKNSDLYHSSLKNVFSRDMFSLMLKFFHLANNELDNQSDKLFKIRNFVDDITEKFKKYFQPGKQIAIDEKMIKFTGRNKMKQFLKDKPTKWGFKVFVLADSVTGYVYALKIYEGKGKNSTKCLTSKVINFLIEGLQNKGHHLYMDSYYTNYDNIIELSKAMIGVTGTVKKTSKNLPNAFKNLKKLPRGEYKSLKNGNILCIIWQDTKLVRMMSNIDSSQEIIIGDRKKPEMVRKYNLYMGGVDKGDQFSSFYNNENRLVKWWMRIFISLLDIALMNSFILFSDMKSKKMPQIEFREYIIKSYLTNYYNSRNQTKKLIYPTITSSFTNGKQHYLKKRVQRNCCICSTSDFRKTTVYYCVACDKNVHPEKCFYILHNSEKIHKRDKYKNFCEIK